MADIHEYLEKAMSANRQLKLGAEIISGLMLDIKNCIQESNEELRDEISYGIISEIRVCIGPIETVLHDFKERAAKREELIIKLKGMEGA